MEKAAPSASHPGAASRSGPAGASASSGDRGAADGKSPGSRSGSGQAGCSAGARRAGSGGAVPPPLEGLLSKYTNLLQGWQNRFFVLDTDAALLLYFVNEPSRGQKPRGVLPLNGAVVSLSDEAPHMFVVNSSNGESYKLRAADAKEQQVWVSQLQACVKSHAEGSAKIRKKSDENLCVDKANNRKDSLGNPTGRARSFSLLPHGTSNSASPSNQKHLPHSGGSSIVTITHHKSPAAARRAKNQYPGRLLEVKEIMSQAEGQQKSLVHSIEALPTRGPLTSLDQDLLLLKATSAATLSCLGECLNILQQNVSQASQHSKTLPPDGVPGWLGPKSYSAEHLKNGSLNQIPSTRSAEPSPALTSRGLQCTAEPPEPEVFNPAEEVTDTEDEEEEEDATVMEEQRSVILHLLSKLKLGMDLTRVALPAFILKRKSLLEMYANFMAHPDMFLSITAGSSPEERIILFVEYYLTAFHEGWKGTVAKKPYNPTHGETFHCSWDVPKDKVKPLATGGPPAATHEEDPSDCYKLRFLAEQVSHHPPVSGFYCECKERRLCVNAHVLTKTKFLGMSVGISMAGEGVLFLLEHDEEYVFTLPCAYVRSILTVPWMELGGKVTISCAKTGYSASVTFHTKPFYGGKVHRVTAEVKDHASNTIVCKAQGEWNGTLEFAYSSGDTKVIDTSKLPVIKKKIRPLKKQSPYESRRVWHGVTSALREGDLDAATESKNVIEEQQRAHERLRVTNNIDWKAKYFNKEGEGWQYHRPLWKEL
ncbi:oxysterol-binding protein-related protein 10 [Erpetoichthys calabaricus]|uniref:Oxysterol-binding protein n=1 Tax=Erpetoichthys calabaricus TaxID=27687 RepID=A0A8C4XB70_ERPCA|nr:oxysterol-binding protein-related protein 10 [Erpetoichthys calabaricus]